MKTDKYFIRLADMLDNESINMIAAAIVIEMMNVVQGGR